MIKNYIKGRVAIFIDASNILYSQQTLGWEIDYEKLILYFKTHTNLITANFYSGKRSDKKNQEKFLRKMHAFGYKVVTKEVKWIKDKNGKILKGKGNLDIELAIDLTHNLEMYDTAILISGDSDFEPAVKFVKIRGKKILIISSRGHVAKELIYAADKYIPLEKLKHILKRVK